MREPSQEHLEAAHAGLRMRVATWPESIKEALEDSLRARLLRFEALMLERVLIQGNRKPAAAAACTLAARSVARPSPVSTSVIKPRTVAAFTGKQAAANDRD